MLVGSKVSKVQYDKVWGFIETGKKEGAKVRLGGQKRTGKGFFVDPTSTFIWCPESR
jgi:aldehyde dehydrogenase (NAD+)